MRAAAQQSWAEKIWSFVRFAVVTGMIFAALFFLINFDAYRQIFSSIFDPAAQAKAEAALEDSTGATLTQKGIKLLPTPPEKVESRKSFSWVDISVTPTDNRIVVPKLGKSVPIVEMSTEFIEGQDWSQLEKQIQGGLQKGVVHYPGTAKPGQYGNFFVTGHSSYYPWDPGQYKDVFALLSKLEPGDRYYVYYDQQKYVYEVTKKFEVQPSVVDVLDQPKDKKVGTLMTCTPVGTALRRLIIQSVLI